MTRADPRRNADDLFELAQEAYVYALPMVVLETYRRRCMARGGMQRFLHAPRLFTASDRQITTPNCDTLYSDLWLDLSQGPARIRFPGTGERFFSLMLLDAYTNNIAVLGTRTTGPAGVDVTLIGPQHSSAGIAGEVIRAPTPTVYGLARILVDSDEDLAAARALQALLQVEAPAADPAETEPVTRDTPSDLFFAEANRLIRRNRPPVTDLALLRRIAPLGVGPDDLFDATRFSPAEAEAIEAGTRAIAARLARIQTSMARGGNGWVWPRRNLGVYGQDYFLRAAVSVGGLGALPLEEATYLRSGGTAGEPFDGRRLWRLHFAAGNELPVDAFWSLSLYEATPSGEFFFVPNPLGGTRSATAHRGCGAMPTARWTSGFPRKAPARGAKATGCRRRRGPSTCSCAATCPAAS